MGVTLVEVMVVSTAFVILAAASLPVLQLVRQREKERRLKKILLEIKNTGIGIGATSYKIDKNKKEVDFASLGYKNFIIRRIILNSANPAQQKFALDNAKTTGKCFPLNPTKLENAQGDTINIDAEPPAGNVMSIDITQRFIRNIASHPFHDWHPDAHWEFLPHSLYDAAGVSISPIWLEKTDGLWAGDWADAKNNNAFGVTDVRSVGAGLAINGKNTDDFPK
jgi:type II secretory pathway pseudopilin PulG